MVPERRSAVAAMVAMVIVVLPPDSVSAGRVSRTLGFHLYAKENASSELVEAIESCLRRLTRETPGLRELAAKKDNKATRQNDRSTGAPCGTHIRCLVARQRDSGADEVVIGRALPRDEGGVIMQLIVFSSGGELLRKTAFAVPSTSEVETIVEARWSEISAIRGVAQLLTMNNRSTRTQKSIATSRASHADGRMAEDESLALVPPGGVLSSPSESQSEKSTPSSPGSALVYSGVGIGALGLIALGVAAYFGFNARSTNTRIDGIESGPQGTPQLEARRLNQRAEDSAGRANLLFTIGGLATAAGATLLVVDLWLLGPSHAAAVNFTSDGEAILSGVSVQW